MPLLTSTEMYTFNSASNERPHQQFSYDMIRLGVKLTLGLKVHQVLKA